MNESYRIAVVTKKPFAGLRTFRRSLAFSVSTLLESRRHQVVLFVQSDSEAPFEPPEGLQVIFYKPGGLNRAFEKEHGDLPFDVIHGLDRSALPLARRKAQLNVKVTFDVEATQMTQIFALMGMTSSHWTSLISTALAVAYKFLSTYFKFDRQLLALADGLIVSSQAQANLLEWFYLYPPAKTFLIPVSPVRAWTEEVEPDLKKKWNLPAGPILLFMTSLKLRREFEATLRAFQALAIKKPTAYLLVLGQGPEMPVFERLVYDLALGGRVKFLGAQTLKRTAEAISVSDVVINFQLGTIGLDPFLLDAMMAGKVAIGSDIGPFADSIRGGKEGFAIKMTHQMELKTIFLELGQRPELRAQIGALGRARAEELLEPGQIAAKMDLAFQAVLQGARRSQRPAA